MSKATILIELQQLQTEFQQALAQATQPANLEQVRIKFLSRQGLIPEFLKQIKDLAPEDKIKFGPQLQEFRKTSEQEFSTKKDLVLAQNFMTADQSASSASNYKPESKHSHHQEINNNPKINSQNHKNLNLTLDPTSELPNQKFGSLHPYTQVIEKLENIFISMGFRIAEGPELETEFNNFTALNIPDDHPARDSQDTFWLRLPQQLMRTQTSPVQIRELSKQELPVAVIAAGRAYRNEATDASHDFVFMQLEGLLVDKNISVANLLGTLKTCLRAIFEREDLDIRVRPGFFPFVEPGLEIDMLCPFCTAGCSVCKRTRWIEIVGAGLVHPNVLRACGIEPQEYSGFAFGFGLTRLVMLKYGINDIRLLHSGKLDFLTQF